MLLVLYNNHVHLCHHVGQYHREKYYFIYFKSQNKIVFLSNESEMQFINYPAV